MSRLVVRAAVTVMPVSTATWMVPGPTGHRDGLAGVGQADLDSLAADHDGSADGDPPGDDEGGGQAGRLGGPGPGSAQPRARPQARPERRAANLYRQMHDMTAQVRMTYTQTV
jgi:hypothetical protein